MRVELKRTLSHLQFSLVRSQLRYLALYFLLASKPIMFVRDLQTGIFVKVPSLTISWFMKHPGRHLICVNVALPRGTLLAEPFTEECLWRQSRGSVVDLSTFEGELKSRKV